MSRALVAGNWKMKLSLEEAKSLLEDIKRDYDGSTPLMVCPSYVYIPLAVEMLKGTGIMVGSQDSSVNAPGAYTGEVSTEMLSGLGVDATLVGHSERREYHVEGDELVNAKLIKALESGMKVVLCFGEVLEERKSGDYHNVIRSQVDKGLRGVSDLQMENVVLAYEPVWAIGTGETASAEQAQEVHAAVRMLLAELFNPTVANKTSILYGGSCKPANAKELFAQADVDGGLIGGAALKAADFLAISKSY